MREDPGLNHRPSASRNCFTPNKPIAAADGTLIATQTTIWRKDRSRPIRLRAYCKECKGNTQPWNKIPARMLGYKSFIQTACYPLRFSGITTEVDVLISDVSRGADQVPPVRNATRAITEKPAADDPSFDESTGEIGRA